MYYACMYIYASKCQIASCQSTYMRRTNAQWKAERGGGLEKDLRFLTISTMNNLVSSYAHIHNNKTTLLWSKCEQSIISQRYHHPFSFPSFSSYASPSSISPPLTIRTSLNQNKRTALVYWISDAPFAMYECSLIPNSVCMRESEEDKSIYRLHSLSWSTYIKYRLH